MNAPYYADEHVTLHHGDCLDVLRALPDSSVDAIVTDPPYGLEFMGAEWDSFKPSSARLRKRVDGRTNPTEGKSVTTTPEAYVAGAPFQAWCQAWATEALRVLKPGGHMIAFGGSRTWHRLVCGVEDAGFEIRDSIAWLYGSGFPKSHNLDGDHEGWGTALKPGFEPAMVARKPLTGTVAANVTTYGTGALNIDACRVEASESTKRNNAAPRFNGTTYAAGETYAPEPWTSGSDAGRWPSNVAMDEFIATDLDRQAGKRAAGARPASRAGIGYGSGALGTAGERITLDSGGASRFFPTFRYQAKAPSSERPSVDGIAHETVKPLDLMRWLVRLVTPTGGLVLDPFAGSGTTAEACVIEGFRCIAIERDAKYLPLITSRLTKPLQPALFAA